MESFPDVGSVTFVVPVDVRVTEFDPDVSSVDCPVNIIPLDDTVNAPELTVGDVIEGDVKVLFVSVSVVARPTKVSVDVGNVSVPVLEIVEITGDVSVLLVNVSVVSLPTSVVVDVGNVIVPVFEIVLITGDVSVLFVSV